MAQVPPNLRRTDPPAAAGAISVVFSWFDDVVDVPAVYVRLAGLVVARRRRNHCCVTHGTVDLPAHESGWFCCGCGRGVPGSPGVRPGDAAVDDHGGVDG